MNFCILTTVLDFDVFLASLFTVVRKLATMVAPPSGVDKLVFQTPVVEKNPYLFPTGEKNFHTFSLDTSL